MAVLPSPQRRVLALAASQIGYSRWTDPKRGTRYARETQPVFWPQDSWLLANGISYCDIFVTWVFWKALGEDFVTSGALPAGASYNTDYRASRGGRVTKGEARPGDILVFDWNWATPSTNHVGILEARLTGDRFQSIEGNTSPGTSGSQSNGGGVHRRIRRHSQVRYVIRPDWTKALAPADTTTAREHPWNSSATINALSKAAVREVQEQLLTLGHDLGRWGADGSYGEATYNAVRAFQKTAGLTVDGVAGPKTRTALTTAQPKPKAPAAPAAPKAPAAPAAPRSPVFPLPKGFYYGSRRGPQQSVSGHVRNRHAPRDVVRVKGKYHSKGLKLWQQRMLDRGWKGIGNADGLYGAKTERVARQFQEAKGLTVDGKIGPKTFEAAWLEPVQ